MSDELNRTQITQINAAMNIKDILQDFLKSRVDYNTKRKVLSEKIKKLHFRKREIVKLRYGVETNYCYTLEEIGKVFNVTRERIRQLLKEAMIDLENKEREESVKSA